MRRIGTRWRSIGKEKIIVGVNAYVGGREADRDFVDR